MAGITFLFFLSGHSAILYQIIWQRALFTLFGTNVESVTAIVAAFMLGLGLGSLAGGRLSSRWPGRLLLLFAGLEGAIGLFGLVSLSLFTTLGQQFAGAGMAGTGVAAFFLVLLPTLFMGATLPLLTAWLVPRLHHVGKGVGMLYAINTLGSASACFLATEFLMGSLGQANTVTLAGLLNLGISFAALALHWRGSRVGPLPLPAAANQAQDGYAAGKTGDREVGRNHPPSPTPAGQVVTGEEPLPGLLYPFLAALSGFISLSLEILWMRAYAFLSGGSAKDFGHLLGFFLVGITAGALLGRRITATPLSPNDRRWVLSALLISASLWSFLSIPAMGWVATRLPPVAALVVVGIGAALWATLLPLISHLTLRADQAAGEGLSRLYLMNILGSVAGSLLTGFVLMDHFDTAAISLMLTSLGLLAALQPWLTGGNSVAPGRPVVVATLATAILGLIPLYHPLMGDLYQRLLFLGPPPYEGQAFVEVRENRSGIIAITADGTIYGGGVYDGRLAVDFVNDTNGIFRPFGLSAFHPQPRRVLMIGLSGGAWAQVVGNHPQVEELVVVEINPGYLEIIRHTPSVASILANPRIKIIIDDGRRWIAHHPDERFDAILMNTTWNWRAFSSNILSREFLELVKPLMNPGAVLMYNATGSREVQRTAALAFPHALRFANQVVVSNAPLEIDLERWERLLRQHRIDGLPVVDQSPAALQAIAWFVQRFQAMDRTRDQTGAEIAEWNSTESRQHLLDASLGARIVTDDNMGTEWLRSRRDP
ncbi:MAG: spermidine synthase [Magnetococcales bacterium]|nr:spermidine synthase [Magnetococcales bacterium]MBF0157763.1 spermidine synthase [Magnetococcales bacterium]